jgi:predicted HTH domain antitoxin
MATGAARGQARALQEFDPRRCEEKNWRNSHDQDHECPNGPGKLQVPPRDEPEELGDLSKTFRDLVTRVRILLAVEKYGKGEGSLGKAAGVAGLSVGQMMTLPGEFGVRSRIDLEDYRQSLANLTRIWREQIAGGLVLVRQRRVLMDFRGTSRLVWLLVPGLREGERRIGRLTASRYERGRI